MQKLMVFVEASTTEPSAHNSASPDPTYEFGSPHLLRGEPATPSPIVAPKRVLPGAPTIPTPTSSVIPAQTGGIIPTQPGSTIPAPTSNIAAPTANNHSQQTAAPTPQNILSTQPPRIFVDQSTQTSSHGTAMMDITPEASHRLLAQMRQETITLLDYFWHRSEFDGQPSRFRILLDEFAGLRTSLDNLTQRFNAFETTTNYTIQSTAQVANLNHNMLQGFSSAPLEQRFNYTDFTAIPDVNLGIVQQPQQQLLPTASTSSTSPTGVEPPNADADAQDRDDGSG